MISVFNIGKKDERLAIERARDEKSGRKTLSDVTEPGRIRVCGERLSNHSSSLVSQEAVCFCRRHALHTNSFQQAY